MNKLLYSYKVQRNTILFLGLTQSTISDTFLIRTNRFTRRKFVKVKNNPQEWARLYTFNTHYKSVVDGGLEKTTIIPHNVAIYETIINNEKE